MPSFPYSERAAVARQRHEELRPAYEAARRNPSLRHEWHAAGRAAREATEAAYPPGFWEDFERVRKGDSAGLETAIEFLKADPIFHRSGDTKAKLLQGVKRCQLSPGHLVQLRAITLHVIAQRGGQEFREHRRLAHRLDSAAFRADLERLEKSPSRRVALRARLMLAAIAEAGGA